MDNKDWTLWNNITFKILGYHKNFDLINDGENIITEYEGSIFETRLSEKKSPILIGEFSFSVWDIDLGLLFKIDFNKLIKTHAIEDTYAELYNIILKKELDINSFKRIILIHTFILRKDYRKHGIAEELIEMFFRNFYYSKKTPIIALIKPFQYNPIDMDFYYKRKFISIKEENKSAEITSIPAFEYYNLNELMEKVDVETNEYKLFTVANRCGLNRIDDSYLFMFSPEKTFDRMTEKNKNLKIKNNTLNSFDKQ
jgi:hypothetical protein